MSWVGVGLGVGGLALSAFSSPKKESTAQTMTTTNAPLESYMARTRQLAPYIFNTLDPSATIAFSKNKGKKAYAKFMASPQGKQITAQQAQEQKEAQFMNEAMERIAQRQKSGEFLTPQETEFVNQSLDKAFESARKFGIEDIIKVSQASAGGRGLRTSDTAILEPTLRETRNFELGLGSQRAQLGVQTTMQLSAQQQAFDEAIREFQSNLFFNRWQTRQAQIFGAAPSVAGIQQTQMGSGSISSPYTGYEVGRNMMTLAGAGGGTWGANIGKGISGFVTGWGSSPKISQSPDGWTFNPLS